MKRIAVFPGSFDPITTGHEDILYFLANGCIQYGIDLASLPVFVQGTHFDSNYTNIFESYVRQVQFSENMQANSLNDLWKLHLLCA